MRSTRASAAVARLNGRCEGRQFMLVVTSGGLFKLRERIAGEDRLLSDALALDDFVRLVNAMGPQKEPRITKNDAAFARQLRKEVKP